MYTEGNQCNPLIIHKHSDHNLSPSVLLKVDKHSMERAFRRAVRLMKSLDNNVYIRKITGMIWARFQSKTIANLLFKC